MKRIGFAVTAIMLSLSVSTALLAGDWTPVYEGIEYQSATKTSPRVEHAYALRIDTQNPAVSFFATPGNGSAPRETTRQTTPNFRSAYGLEAAVNANFFSMDDPTYAYVEGLLISNGSTISLDQAGRQSQLLITAAKEASIAYGGNPSGIHTAVAGAELCLMGGSPAGDNGTPEPRTGIGVSQDGRFIILVVIDGRGAGGSQGCTIYEVGQWLKDFGAWNGFAADGGGSSTLCTASGGVLNHPSEGSPRAVGANFGVNASANISRLDVFACGTNNDIYQKTWTSSGGWGGFTSIGAPSGGATSDPSCVSRQPGVIDVFVRGTDGQCYHRWYSNGNWNASGWEAFGANIVGAPDACSWNYNRVDVFARGSNDHLYQKTFNGSTWGSWTDLSFSVYSDPSAVSWGPGRIDLFYKGSAGDIVHKAYVSGSGWYAAQSMGGGLIDGPDACAWAVNRLDVFIRGTNDDLYINSWDGSAWTGWLNKGGTMSSGPGCGSHSNGSFNVFARGGNGSDDLYEIHYASGSGWSTWTSLGGGIVGGPDACSWTNDAGLHQ